MQVSVIGAGFSGLSAAFYLQRLGAKVHVYERSAEPGGLLHTDIFPWGLAESAANGMRSSAAVEDMAGAIGLTLVGASSKNRKRYIFRGRPRQMPLSSLEFLRVSAGLLRRRPPVAGTTLAQWAESNFGYGALRYLVEPAVAGIFAERPENLSAKLVYDYFFRNRPQRAPNIPRGTVAPPQGMGAWVRSLGDYLRREGVEFSYNTAVEDIRTFQPHDAHAVVLATDAVTASDLLAPVDPWVSRLLGHISYNPLVSATLAWKNPVAQNLRGFGCLLPSMENFNSFGVLFNSDIFPRENSYRSETWILPPPKSFMVQSLSDHDVLNLILADRERLLGASGAPAPDEMQVYRWAKALPRYDVNLEKVLAQLVLPPNVFLVGNYLGGLGLAKILDHAAMVSQKIWEGHSCD